ncbi:hypothetical protein JCM10213_002829 [Rhodosporidiobolus nylandii]
MSQENTKDSQATSRLNLLNLPVELVERIFEEAYDSGSFDPIGGPACRALLPLHRRGVFKRIFIQSAGALGKLWGAISQNEQLGQYVESLTVSLEYDAAQGELPRSRDLVRLFSLLPYLSYLRVSSAPKICYLILSPDVASNSSVLPNLRQLHFDSTLPVFSDAFQPLHYAALAYYPSLTRLRLDVRGTCKEDLASRRPVPAFHLAGITDLSLSIDYRSRSTCQLLSLFSRLTVLHLVKQRRRHASLAELLAGVPNPSFLRVLQIDGSVESRAWSISESLAAFTSLTSLHLDGNCDMASRAMFDVLRGLPLEDLHLGLLVDPSAAELAALVAGAQKHQTLRLLELAHETAVMGTSVEDEGLFYDAETGRYGPHPDWYFPTWTTTFSHNGCARLLEAARQGGVEVSGSTVLAFECDDDVREAWRVELAVVGDMVQEMEDEDAAEDRETDEEPVEDEHETESEEG